MRSCSRNVTDSEGGLICEFKNRAKIIIVIALLKKNQNSRILKFVSENLNTQKLPELQ